MITSQDSNAVYIWYHAAGALTIVIGDSGMGPEIRDFVDAYLKTANT